MLVNVDDKVGKLDHVRRDQLLPSLICPVVVLNDKINGATGPCEKPLQLVQRLVDRHSFVCEDSFSAASP
jgi:hypothetical protein